MRPSLDNNGTALKTQLGSPEEAEEQLDILIDER